MFESAPAAVPNEATNTDDVTSDDDVTVDDRPRRVFGAQIKLASRRLITGKTRASEARATWMKEMRAAMGAPLGKSDTTALRLNGIQRLPLLRLPTKR